MASNADLNVDKQMMPVILKTLDGQNKEFQLPIEMSVSDFKNEISQTLNIPPAQQRLIFQGKVLQDGKKLKEYGVADKVVHLVPRPPPRANSSSVSSSPSRDVPRRERTEDVADINAIQNMVENILSGMGEFGQTADVIAQPVGSGLDILVNINPQNPRMSLARIRQMYLQRIEEQVRAILSYLADPINTPLPSPDYQVLRQESPFQTINSQSRGTPSTSSSRASTSETRETDSTTAQAESNGASVPSNEPLPITALADMMDRVRALYDDAQPYIDRWQTMLRDDAELGDTADAAQKFYDTVNRVVHLLSHMMHNVSDFIVEFNNDSQRPRRLLILSESSVDSVQTHIHIDSSANGAIRMGRRPASVDRTRLSRSSTATTNIPAASSESATGNAPSGQQASSTQQAATPDSNNPQRRSLSATRVPSTPANRTDIGRGLGSRSRPINSINRIQTSDGGVYVTASSQPRTFVEMRPNALSVNSMSAHIVAAAVDMDRDSNERGGSARNQSTGNSGSGESTERTRDNTPLMGMPRVFLQQILESALRNSFEMTNIGSENTTRENSQTAESAARRDAPATANVRPPPATPENPPPSGGNSAHSTTGNSIGSVLRGSLHPGHAVHPSSEIDPYLPCHSRHYMDHESVNESLEGRRLAMNNLRRVPVPQSTNGPAPPTRNENSGNASNRVVREVHMFPIIPRNAGFSAAFSNGTQNHTAGATPSVNIRNNMEAMSNVLSAMLGGALPTAHSGRTGTATTNTATTGSPGNTSTTTGSSASTGASSAFGGAIDIQTLQNLMTAMVGSFNTSQTEGSQARLSDLFSQMTGSSLLEESPTSLLGDASNLLLNEWNTSDIISLVFLHDRRALDRLRVPLQTLITAREREAGSRQSVIDGIITDCKHIYSPAIDNSEFSDIDVGDSVAALLKHHLSLLLTLVADSPTDTGFGGLVVAHLTHLSEEAIILLQLICNDDDARLERLLQQLFDSWTNSFMREQHALRGTPADFPVLYQWVSNMLRGNTSRMMDHEVETLRRNVSRFIVYRQSQAPTAGDAAQTAGPNTIEISMPAAVDNEEPMDSSEFSTPPESSSPRAGSDVSFSDTTSFLIDCMPTAEELKENPLVPHPDVNYPILKRNPAGSLTSEEPEAMDTSGAGSSPDWNECTPGDGSSTESAAAEGWHALLPQEWVQVVARDVDTQRQSTGRALPFIQSRDPASDNNTTLSDAYLAGMPAKRRKLMLAAKEVILQPANLLLTDCVREAVRQSGTSSSSQTPSNNDLGAAAASSDVNPIIGADNPLSQAFKDYVTEKMVHRLEQDQDYLPEQFPDSERVFRGRNKTARKSPSAFNDSCKFQEKQK